MTQAAAGAQQPIRNTRQNLTDCKRIIRGLEAEKDKLKLAEKSGGVLKTLKDKAADMKSLLDLMRKKDTARAHQQILIGLESDLLTIEALISNESEKFADLNTEIDQLNAQVQAVLAGTKAYDPQMYVTYGKLEQDVKIFLIPASATDNDAPLTKLRQLERNLTGQNSHYAALGQLHQQALQKERIGKKVEFSTKTELIPLYTMLAAFRSASPTVTGEILKIINTIQHLQNETKNNIGTAREKLKEYLKLIIKQHQVVGVDDTQADSFIDMIIGYAAHTGRRMHLPFSVSRTNSIEQIMNHLAHGTQIKVDHSKKNVIDIAVIDSDIANKKQEISRLGKAEASIAHKSEIVKAVSNRLTQIISNIDEAKEIEETLNRTDQDLQQATPPQSHQSFSVVTMQQSYDQEKQQLIQAHAAATAALAQKKVELHRVKVQSAVTIVKSRISELKLALDPHVKIKSIDKCVTEASRRIGSQGTYQATHQNGFQITVPKIHPFAQDLLAPQITDGLHQILTSIFGDNWIQSHWYAQSQQYGIRLNPMFQIFIQSVITYVKGYMMLLHDIAKSQQVSITDILKELTDDEKTYLKFIDTIVILDHLLHKPHLQPGTLQAALQKPADLTSVDPSIAAAAQRLGMA